MDVVAVQSEIVEGAASFLSNVNEGRLWLGRKLDSIADAIHPKTVFFPGKTISKVIDLVGKVFNNAEFINFSKSIGSVLSFPQALFAVTGLRGLLNINPQDCLPPSLKSYLNLSTEDQKSDSKDQHHHENSLKHRHMHHIKEFAHIKSIANVFDYTGGMFNCGLGAVLSKAGLIGGVLRHTMHRINGMMMLPRNILSLGYHSAIAAKDFTSLISTFGTEKSPTMADAKELVWKNGVPIIRYGALILPVLGFLSNPIAAVAAQAVSFGMGTIQIFSEDFKNEDVGGGCC